jgi:hypothetical protein
VKVFENIVEPVVALVTVTETVPDTVLPLTVRDGVIATFNPSKVRLWNPGGLGGSAIVNCRVIEGRLQLQPPPDTPIVAPAMVVVLVETVRTVVAVPNAGSKTVLGEIETVGGTGHVGLHGVRGTATLAWSVALKAYGTWLVKVIVE